MSAVLSMPKGRAMVSPDLLRQFREDCETVRASRQTAMEYIEAEDARAKSEAAMRRTREAAIECGTALKRMHDSESYLDNHANWNELCKALKINRRHSYRMMTYAEKASNADEKGELPLSVVSMPEAEPEEPAAQEESPAEPSFAKLREMLKSTPRDQINEAEAPAKPKNEQDAEWVKRQAASLLRWFEAKNLAGRASDHINALIELATSAA